MRKNLREAEEVGRQAARKGVPRDRNPLAGQEASAWDRGHRRESTRFSLATRDTIRLALIKKKGGK